MVIWYFSSHYFFLSFGNPVSINALGWFQPNSPKNSVTIGTTQLQLTTLTHWTSMDNINVAVSTSWEKRLCFCLPPWAVKGGVQTPIGYLWSGMVINPMVGLNIPIIRIPWQLLGFPGTLGLFINLIFPKIRIYKKSIFPIGAFKKTTLWLSGFPY